MAISKKGLLLVSVSKVNLRSSENVSKVPRVWIGDLYKQKKLDTFSPILVSKFMLSFKSWVVKMTHKNWD